MMLRASAMTTDTEVYLQGVVGNKTSAATGIAFGAELMHFSESIALRDEKIIAESRKALLAAAGCFRRCVPETEPWLAAFAVACLN